jgi:transcription antitermination protein NusB
MGARRTARERALQALYQLDMGSVSTPVEALESAWNAASDAGGRDASAQAFAKTLVSGVREHLAEIDGLIEAHSHNWRLDRMSRVDRNVLRIGIYELKYCAETPLKVTINEAVELGKTFGNEDSSAFINGLLDKVAAAVGRT